MCGQPGLREVFIEDYNSSQLFDNSFRHPLTYTSFSVLMWVCSSKKLSSFITSSLASQTSERSTKSRINDVCQIFNREVVYQTRPDQTQSLTHDTWKFNGSRTLTDSVRRLNFNLLTPPIKQSSFPFILFLCPLLWDFNHFDLVETLISFPVLDLNGCQDAK